MKSFVFNRITTLASMFILVVIPVCLAHAELDNKLAPADIITKHLESIGSSEARARSRDENQRDV